MYHNTCNLSGGNLEKAVEKTYTQDEAVYMLFSQRSRDFTPSEALHSLEEMINFPPLTSIRRSISNLTKAGLLVKTENKRKGIYGKHEYAWKRAFDPTDKPDLYTEFDHEAFEKSLFEPENCGHGK